MKKLLSQALNQGNTFQELIQDITISFKKGENGLLVKNLRDNLSKDGQRLVDEYIESFNEVLFLENLMDNTVLRIYDDFSNKKFLKKELDDDFVKECFLLFCLNYVFVIYSNKKFRKMINVVLK